MRGCLTGCLGRIFALVLLAGGVYAAWYWGPSLYPQIRERFSGEDAGEVSEASFSAQLADSAIRRFESFRSGGSSRFGVSGVEISSVLMFARPDLLPTGVEGPEVKIEEDRLLLSAHVVKDSFPGLPDFLQGLEFFPDTVPFAFEASLVPVDSRRKALVIHRASAGGLPLPEALLSEVLHLLGRTDHENLPEDAVLMTLPAGVDDAFVLRDSLIFITGR